MCRNGALEDQPRRIRQARGLARAKVPSRMFEVMIAAGAFESAALLLLGEDAAWMLSRGARGRCLASLLLPGMSEEVTCEAASPALALLGAWACAALARAQSGEVPAEAALPSRPAGVLLN
jgi:hypothetical protein